MKKLLLIGSLCLLSVLEYASYAQSLIVFTSISNDTQKFWQLNTDTPLVYVNLSEKLDAIAPFEGNDYGPITVSHDGNWYAFLSERFDENAQGWPALTITNRDFSSYEVIHNANGELIHSEDKACVVAGGNTIIFVADMGNHTRDIFAIHKNGNSWGTPVNLTENSTYNYNYCPALSADDTRVLFDAGNTPFPSTAIGRVNIDKSDLSFPLTAASMTNGIAAHSPSENSNGDIFYEGDASGESIWKLSAGNTIPTIINASYVNDNSPVILPDGRIASLWLPGSYHQIKIMNADGTNYSLYTDSSECFTEVFDVGLTACPANPAGIDEITDTESVLIYPNPAKNYFRITINKHSTENRVIIYNASGKKISEHELKTTGIHTISVSGYPEGSYYIRVFDGKAVHCKKIIIM